MEPISCLRPVRFPVSGGGQRVRTRLLIACALLLLAPGLIAQKKPTKQQLKTDLSKLRTEKEAWEKRLRATKAKAREAAQDVAQVDTQLSKVEDALDQTTARLGSARDEQAKVAVELKEAERKLEERRVQVRKRVRQMYIRGQGSVVAELISSRSLGELADRRYIMERIAVRDRELFAEFRILKDQVAAKKLRVDQLVTEIGALAASQRERQGELEVVREAKADVLGELRTQQGKLQRIIAQLDAEENEIQARIDAYNRRPGPKLPAFTGKFGKPVNAPMGNRRFGVRRHPILGVMRMHSGIDFGARHGAPIFAAAGGVVISASYGRGYGNNVIIDHGGGQTTLYAHASRLSVRSGQRVRRGQVIAAVGSTGLSTGPHLHFEVRVNGRAVNPLGRF